MSDSILIIEGEPSLSKELASAFTEAGFAVDNVPDYPEALLKIDEFKPDMVIVDESLPGRDGIEVCSQLRGTFGVPVVLLGEDSSDEVWERVMEADADLYLTKPISYRVLTARLRAILRRYKRCRNNWTGEGNELRKSYRQFDYSIGTEDVAKNEGLKVINWPLLSPIEEVKSGKWVGIREGLLSEQRRWDIAHAIGHHLMHHGNQLLLAEKN